MGLQPFAMIMSVNPLQTNMTNKPIISMMEVNGCKITLMHYARKLKRIPFGSFNEHLRTTEHTSTTLTQAAHILAIADIVLGILEQVRTFAARVPERRTKLIDA